MDMKIYEYLIAVEENKNITKAAQRCYISQPALTQHIKKIEAQLNFSIFVKSGKSLIPTDQGKIYLATAKRMLQIQKETLSRISELKATSKSTYRIFVDNTMYDLFTQAICQDLQQNYPKLRLSILYGNSNDALNYLDDKSIDAAIIMLNANPSKLNYIPFKKSEYLLLAPYSGAYYSSNNDIDIQLLANNTFIYSPPYTFYNMLEKKILAEFFLTPSTTIQSKSINDIPNMVSGGEGIGFCPDYLFKDTSRTISYSFKKPILIEYVVAFQKGHALKSYDIFLADLLIKQFK